MNSRAPAAHGGWLFTSQTSEELRRSFTLHVRRPLILFVVVFGSVLQFGVEMWAAREAPVPGDLAGMFAAPPIDSFSWALSGLALMPLLLLLAIRLTVLWLFICLVLGIRPARDNMLRTTGAYLGSVLTFGLLSAALAKLGPLAGGLIAHVLGSGPEDPYLAGARLALGLVFYLAFVPMLVLFTVIVSPLIARSAAGQHLKPRLRNGAVWLLATASALLYVFSALRGHGSPDVSSGSFARAFVVLSFQSLIVAAIVHISAGSAAMRMLSE